MNVQSQVVCFLLVAVFSSEIITGKTYNDSTRLKNDLMKKHDNRNRPVLDQTEIVIVNVSFDIVALLEFEEVDGKLFIGGEMFLTWIDETMRWDPSDYGGIYSEIFKHDKIWNPNLIMLPTFDDIDNVLKDWMSARVIYDGQVFFSPAAVFKSKCFVDVTFYPFDKQTCFLLFMSSEYTTEELILNAEVPFVYQNFYIEHGGWTLESTKAETGLSTSFGVSYTSFIRFDFEFKRKSAFLTLNTIVPITLMLIMNVFVFLLPPESGERISYAITVLLAIAVFLTLVGDNLPKVSNPVPIISYFLIFDLGISFLICIVTILNLRLYFKDGNDRPPACCRRLAMFICRTSSEKHRKNGNNNLNEERQINEIQMREYTLSNTNGGEGYSWKQRREITWKDVGTAVDMASAVFFFLVTIVITVLYLVVLVTNADGVLNTPVTSPYSLLFSDVEK